MREIKKIDLDYSIKRNNNFFTNNNYSKTVGSIEPIRNLDDVEIIDLGNNVRNEAIVNLHLPSSGRLFKLEVSESNINDSFDGKFYQDKFDSYMALYDGYDARDKTVAAASFLATQLPKLPYFWGGGHERGNSLIGIDSNWGQLRKIEYDGSDHFPKGSEHTFSLDCSGFVSWCLINGGYSNIDGCLGSGTLANLGDKIELKNANLADVKPGDLAWRKNHIGIIVDVDASSNEIKVAHVSDSGDGMNITTISTDTGKIVDDSIGSSGNDRIGKSLYFTHICKMNYE